MVAGADEKGRRLIEPLVEEGRQGQGDGRRRVPPHRLGEEKPLAVEPHLAGLVEDLGVPALAGDDADPVAAEGPEAPEGPLKEALRPGEGEKLLGHLLAGEGPEAGTAASGEDDGVKGFAHNGSSLVQLTVPIPSSSRSIFLKATSPSSRKRAWPFCHSS